METKTRHWISAGEWPQKLYQEENAERIDISCGSMNVHWTESISRIFIAKLYFVKMRKNREAVTFTNQGTVGTGWFQMFPHRIGHFWSNCPRPARAGERLDKNFPSQVLSVEMNKAVSLSLQSDINDSDSTSALGRGGPKHAGSQSRAEPPRQESSLSH